LPLINAAPPTNLVIEFNISLCIVEVFWIAPATPPSAGYRITVNSSGNSTSIDVTISPHNIALQEGVHSIGVRSLSHHHYPSEMVGPVEVTLGVAITLGVITNGENVTGGGVVTGKVEVTVESEVTDTAEVTDRAEEEITDGAKVHGGAEVTSGGVATSGMEATVRGCKLNIDVLSYSNLSHTCVYKFLCRGVHETVTFYGFIHDTCIKTIMHACEKTGSTGFGRSLAG